MSQEGLDRRKFMKGVAAGAVGLGLPRHLLAQEAKKVKRRVLGRTGIEISTVVYGGVRLRPEHLRLLQVAREGGVNMFDVAWGYGRGQAELGIGRFLETVKDREKLYITTKASGYRPPRGTAKEVYTHLKEKVTASLRRMKTDYIDVFMWPHGASNTGFLSSKAMRDAMKKLKQEKLVRHFGLSSHTNYVKVCEAAIEDGFYDVVLTVLNVCTQNRAKAEPFARRARWGGGVPEDTSGMVKLAKKKNVGVLAMKCANPRFLSPNTDDLLKAHYPKQDSPLSRHQKLYGYCLAQPGVAAAVVGIGSAHHLKEALALGAAGP